jgi:hypothetical protein
MMLPDNRNATADNGGESNDHKAAGLHLSVAADDRLTADDRLATFIQGFEAGKAERSRFDFLDRHAAFMAGHWLDQNERVIAEIEDQVLARLHDRSLAALHMARRHAAKTGPNWAALVTESGERDD